MTSRVIEVGKPEGRRVRLEVKWNDCWVGVFWRTALQMPAYEPRYASIDGDEWPPQEEVCHEELDVWVCLIPCLPLHYSHWKTVKIVNEREEYGPIGS